MELMLLPLATAVIGGLIGGWVTHYFATRRDVASKRREIILTNLLAALDDLDRSNTNRPDSDLKLLERVVYKMHVFGDEELVDLTRKMVGQFVSEKSADTTSLMLALRNKVRRELKLSALKTGYQFLTVGNTTEPAYAVAARYTEGRVEVQISDGRVVSVPVSWSKRLLGGTEEQRANIVLTPLGLHWPDFDEDISIASMLRGEKAQGAVAP